jgi:hypothetical protein
MKMMKNFLASLFLFTVNISDINANPFLFFPQLMLPSIGTTFNFTFDGLISTMRVSGVYSIQPVIDQDMKTIIGYRNWQSYTGDFNGTFYGVSYENGTYLQALIDTNTQECINVFSEIMNCTSWLNIQIVRWDSRFSFIRVDSPITGDMTMTLRASTSDLKRPVSFTTIASITGVPDKTTITYDFSSKTEVKAFPYVKCYF